MSHRHDDMDICPIKDAAFKREHGISIAEHEKIHQEFLKLPKPTKLWNIVKKP